MLLQRSLTIKINAMKNKVLKLLVSVTFLIFTLFVGVASGADEGSNYTITPVEEQNLETGVECAWTLVYNEAGAPITICLLESKNSKTYVVRTSLFEVAYVCNRSGFGARNVKDSDRVLPSELTSQVINMTELSNQYLITTGDLDDDVALGLIASYLPDLVNTKYQNLITS